MDKTTFSNDIDKMVQLSEVALGIHIAAISVDDSGLNQIDFSLRHCLFPDTDAGQVFCDIIKNIEERSIYNLTDHFYSQYLLMRLPEEFSYDCILAGPYLLEECTDDLYNQIIIQNHLTMEALPTLKQYFQNLPVVDPMRVGSCLNLIASFIYPNHTDLSIVRISENLLERSQNWTHLPDPKHTFSSHITEERYTAENSFLEAITRGDMVQALKRFDKFTNYRIAFRYKDPVRDIKNLSIVLNTLLRKAAEAGVVHPVYLDEISHYFAVKIENSTSRSQLDAIRLEMVHKYCLLVKNQSLKNYPPLIRNILNYINLNLSTQMTLKSLSQMFNVNASYLSTLFKKETGSTLTDFINGRRIDTALTLLNTSNIQIQDVAYYVGIEDVNYFTRIFKKKIGVAPTEYKRMIRGRQ